MDKETTIRKIREIKEQMIKEAREDETMDIFDVEVAESNLSDFATKIINFIEGGDDLSHA